MNTNERLELSKEKKEMKRKATLLVLSILTILFAVVGFSFAYFLGRVNYVNGRESIEVTTKKVEGVTFQASGSINLKDAVPGDSGSMDFTISNTNKGTKVRYTLTLVADINDFSTEDGVGQLLITLDGKALEEPVTVDFTDSANVKRAVLASNIELDSEQSDVYNLKLEFVELNKSQDTNQEKTFVGHIEVTQSLSVSSNN